MTRITYAILGLSLVSLVLACNRKPGKPSQEHVRRNCLASSPGPAEGLMWQPASEGAIPEGALIGGDDGCYVGRRERNGDWLSGRVCPGNNGIYVAKGDKEYFYRSYQVLVNVNGEDLNWVPASGGNAPNTTVPSNDDCNLFVCKAKHADQWLTGHLDPPENVCILAHAGKGHSLGSYQVLVNNVPDFYNVTSVNYRIPSAKWSFNGPVLLATKVIDNFSERERKIVDYLPYKKLETRRWEKTFGTRKGVRYASSVQVPSLDHHDPRSGEIVMTDVTSYNGTWDTGTDVETDDVVAVIVTIPPRSSRSLSVIGEVGSLRLSYETNLNVKFRNNRKIAKKISGFFVGTQIYNEHAVIGDPVFLDSKK